MMNPIWAHLYTRPGNLWKEFNLMRKVTANQNGHLTSSWEFTGETLKGVLSQAESRDKDRTLNMWDQDQHSLSHILVLRGRAGVKKGDRLDIVGEDGLTYLVLAFDNISRLDGSSLIYLEERNDLK